MHIPGHLGVALIEHRLLTPPKQAVETIRPLLMASFFPDLVDKSIGYIFKLMPDGRHYGHNLFSLVITSLLVTLIWGRTQGYSWFIGYLGHLLADTGTRVPWFFPLKHYHFTPGRLSFEPRRLLLETIFLGLVLVGYFRSRL